MPVLIGEPLAFGDVLKVASGERVELAKGALPGIDQARAVVERTVASIEDLAGLR